MPPKEWPYCYVRGFVVNPLKRCVKCKHKKSLTLEGEEWECSYDAPSQNPKKGEKSLGKIFNPTDRSNI
jgi:hypothetical protein